MVRVAWKGGLIVAAIAAAALPGSGGTAATGNEPSARLAGAASVAFPEAVDSADLLLQFIQVEGPTSGHVRVVLTPETRPLTILEARSAAEQAFLETLKEPGLGDISRVTVVVRLMPQSHPDPGVSEQVIVYQHKTGSDWTVLPGE
jgi:hypothetical protein